ncbi:hypothetical protein EDEG_01065 [Edhazardia aedis USNM 41457]|uniref:Uncharacterized protein n=1 Tax=Edhazardia aedis (strain USNM 41457) TaxID=1003232 RepID=J9DQE0_EDHAE|nr:hypothetical protein EDEG_01065 [Edhazardia aedis USNM 41457]|eukprot:EJW04775.1 hypothetical protein EDEG_01065 [Edhazardia aedis USNM 41457]
MKITLNDLTENSQYTGNTISALLREELKEAETVTKPKKTKSTSKFFTIEPKTDLEKSILNTQDENVSYNYFDKDNSDIVKQPKTLREKVLIARFDAKMKRIKKIKSKRFRRLRRREQLKTLKECDNKEDEEVSDVDSCESNSECANPNDAIKMYEKENTKNRENEIDMENVEGSSSDGLESDSEAHEAPNRKFSSKTDSIKPVEENTIVQKLLKRYENREAAKNVSNIMAFSGNEEIQQDDLVKKLFSGKTENDFEKEFVEEKRTIVENERPQDEVKILEGWGSWIGQGIEIVPTKYNTIVLHKPGINVGDRKDLKAGHVILNNNMAKPNEKYLSDLPYGMTKEQYREKMKLPVCKELNSMRLFMKYVNNDNNTPDDFFVYQSRFKK